MPHDLMDFNHRLDVVVGCPLLLSQLPKAPCLVLDADPQSFDRLHATAAGDAHPWPLTFQQCVLAESDGDDVVWNTFNDARFNGPNEVSNLQQYGLNLVQLDSQIHQGRSLASILTTCSSLRETGTSFRLHLHQGNPVLSLKGAGSWLSRCSQITLRVQRFFENDQVQCGEYLSAHDFCPSEDDSLVWTPTVREISLAYWSSLNEQLAALFNPDAYRRLRSDLKHFTDSELYQHWFNEPNAIELAAEMNKRSNELISKAQLRLLDDDDPIMMLLTLLFPYEYYRSLRSDLQHLTNRELLLHYWECGRFEGVTLSQQGLQAHQQSSVASKLQAMSARIEELEGVLASVRAHQKDSLCQLIRNKQLSDRDQ